MIAGERTAGAVITPYRYTRAPGIERAALGRGVGIESTTVERQRAADRCDGAAALLLRDASVGKGLVGTEFRPGSRDRPVRINGSAKRAVGAVTGVCRRQTSRERTALNVQGAVIEQRTADAVGNQVREVTILQRHDGSRLKGSRTAGRAVAGKIGMCERTILKIRLPPAINIE